MLGVGETVRLGLRVHVYGRNVSLSLERVSIRFQSFISHVCKHLPTHPHVWLRNFFRLPPFFHGLMVMPTLSFLALLV